MDVYHPIKEFPKYQINKNGSIRRVYKNGNITYPKNVTNKNGYVYVSLHNKSYTLHRLLALQFIPNPENKPCVDHINTIRGDYRLENLRWFTKSENARNTLRENKGCIHERKDKYTTDYGKVLTYISYRFFWYPEYNVKKSKTFKTREEAEKFRDSIYPAQSVLIDQ